MSSSYFITDGSIPSAVDRYLDGDLSPEERETLHAHLRADPVQCEAFVAELRLAIALGAALDERQSERGAQAELLMATLSESRSTAALRNLEDALGLEHAPSSSPRWWLPWVSVACAAGLLAAILWFDSARTQPSARHDVATSPQTTTTPPTVVVQTPLPRAVPTLPDATIVVHAPEAPVPQIVTPPVATNTTRVDPTPEPSTPPIAATEPLIIAHEPVLPGVRATSTPRRVHTTNIATQAGDAPLRPPGADAWIGGPSIIHRHSTRMVVRAGSLALLPGDVIDTGEGGGCEVRLGIDCAITCAASTRIVLLPARPTVPGRRLALAWGELSASPNESAPALVSTPHGDVRCESGRTTVRAYPDWVSVVADGGHARVGSENDRKSLDDGQYALLVHGRSVITPTARSQSAILAGILTVHGEALLPCILRLSQWLPPASRADRLHAFADAGFTAISLGCSTIDANFLSDAQGAGLGVMGEVAADSMTSEAMLRGRAHPSILGWWMPGSTSDGLPRDAVRIASTVRKIDPLHILAASFLGDQSRGTPPACDLLVLDHSADDTPTAMAARWSAPTAAAALRAKTVLAAVPLLTRQHDQAIGPSTVVRQRCLAYLALISGARGLVWSGKPASAQDVDAWEDAVANAGALSAELARIAPLILHGVRQKVPVVAGTPISGTAVGQRWDGNGRCAVVLVNPTDHAQPVTATLPGVAPVDPRLLTDEGAGDVHLTGNRLTGTLPPYGAAAFTAELPFTP